MRKIIVFETEDGARFSTQEDAEKHENLLRLKEIYENDNYLQSDYGERVSFAELHAWLHNNKDYVTELLSIEL